MTMSLDGFTYLGFFRWTFDRKLSCSVCPRDPIGYCVIIGHGEKYLIRLCGTCGRFADETLKRGFRHLISHETQRKIAAASGSSRQIACRMGVSPYTVRKYKQPPR